MTEAQTNYRKSYFGSKTDVKIA